MESRGSLRQLHQQIGNGLGGLDRQWSEGWQAGRRRTPPPPPSIPPWAGALGHDEPIGALRPNEDVSVGWNKPRVLRPCPKRLVVPPLQHARVGQQSEDRAEDDDTIPQFQSNERGKLEDRVTQRHENQTFDAQANELYQSTSVASLRAVQKTPHEPIQPSDERISDEDAQNSSSNQTEEEATESETGPVSVGFFRPWKKGTEDSKFRPEHNGQANKWKVRALVNPFAKRKPKAAPEYNDNHPQDDQPQVPVRARTPPPSNVVPRRPLTPSLSDPSVPAHNHPLRPRVLRSRDESKESRYDSNTENDSAYQDQPLAQPEFSRRPFEPRSQPRSFGDEDSRVFGGSDSPPPRAAPARTMALNPITQPAKGKKSKKSTLNALEEIKRKREERRQQQAEEKERVKTELQEHGDDSGYKFRRLIHKYRETLPPAQRTVQSKPGVELPPLSSNSAVSSARLFVFIRKRPLSKKELKAKGYDILTCLFSQNPATGQLDKRLRRELICHEPKIRVDCSESLENHNFHFDGVFDEEQPNEQVYHSTVGPMIPYLISTSSMNSSQSSQTNLTIFAYGQTGSGKTYTMKSVYRQAAVDIFARLESFGRSGITVGVSFYEIYMNTVNDLLNGRSRVQIMEDGDGTVQLPGLKEQPIFSADELLALVKRGEESRATSANAVHDDSSRSHALLRVTMYEDASQTVLARLSMVDLAGSERACDTQSDSKNTRMEGAEINKSLLALKECIRALDRGATHIPFRQSKLTQLLRDSFLSENSKTVMIATASPWSESCNHTLNTLRYADRLKEIGSS